MASPSKNCASLMMLPGEKSEATAASARGASAVGVTLSSVATIATIAIIAALVRHRRMLRRSDFVVARLITVAVVVASAAAAVVAAPRKTAPSGPLPAAHAHNDYWHERPLHDALERGFCSVEADVFLVDGQLLVGHAKKELLEVLLGDFSEERSLFQRLMADRNELDAQLAKGAAKARTVAAGVLARVREKLGYGR